MIEKFCRENGYPSPHCDKVLCQHSSDLSDHSTSSDNTDEFLNGKSINPKKILADKDISCKLKSVYHSKITNVQNSNEINCSSKRY